MYVYQRSEPGLYTVGYYDPQGNWIPESDHTDQQDAAGRVHWLNGATSAHTCVDRPHLPCEACNQ